MGSGRGRVPAASTGGGRWRRAAGVWVGATVMVAVAASALAIGTGGPALHHGARQPCSPPAQPLRVVAAPELGPVIAAAARAGQESAVDGDSCGHIVVVSAQPGDLANELTSHRPDLPDVWIPDSSTWIGQVSAAGLVLPRQHPSIARSPLVLAVPVQVAKRLGWPAQRIEVGQLFPAKSAQPLVRLGLADPQQSVATAGALLGLQASLDGRSDERPTLTAALRASLDDLPAEPTQLLARLAGAVRVAVPVTEQAVWAHSTGSATKAVAAYPMRGQRTLDYPYLVLATDRTRQARAAQLLTTLQGPTGRQLLAARGFRNPEGGAGPALTTARGVDPRAPATAEVPAPEAVAAATRTLKLVRLGSRLLAVVDVSGSMAEPVPGAGGATRLDLTRQAAAAGLGLYPDDTQIGLWSFATHLTPTTDYRQLVPIGPLGEGTDGAAGREKLIQALAGLQPIPTGNTGLYDTVLAAVRAVRQGFDPRRVNSVVLLTDGKNDDDNGISLGQLLASLRQEANPARPVPVITIAYGPDSDTQTLTTISKATGGTTYQAKDPRQIRQIFLDAIGQRPCRPNCYQGDR